MADALSNTHSRKGFANTVTDSVNLKKNVQKTSTELYRISPSFAFVAGFSPALFGAIAAITLSLLLHSDLIANYNWQCGRARLPSLSRIINLPMERIFWQIFILFHIPIRILELSVGFKRYGLLMNANVKRKWLYQAARYCYFYVGIGELLFLGGLSIVGERELISLHVILFYGFGLCGIGFFFASLICHRHSLYYLKPYGRLSYSLKLFFTAGYVFAIPVLVIAFLLYWKACITIAYDVFAICEYVGVLFNIGYHGCTFFDIRYGITVTVNVRRRTDQKQQQQQQQQQQNSSGSSCSSSSSSGNGNSHWNTPTETIM